MAAAEEYQRLILAGGAFSRKEGGWKDLTRGEALPTPDQAPIEERIIGAFLESVRTGNGFWKPIARQALEATRIGLAAEVAQNEGRRVPL